ncbi:hypothetical protein C6P42_004112, partial [Pichia californica]
SGIELEKRDYSTVTCTSDGTYQTSGTVAQQVTTCSLSTFNHGYPSAIINFAGPVKKLESDLYEATMSFSGTDCSKFNNVEEIKIIGGASSVIIYSWNSPGNNQKLLSNGCNWVAPFAFTARYDSSSGLYCMKDGMQIQYDMSSGSWDYSFGCGSGGQYDFAE